MPNSRFAVLGGRAALVIALLVGVFGIYGVVQYTRFNSRLEKLKAAGQLVVLDDLIHRVENQADDSMFYLSRINDAAREFEEEVSIDAEGYVLTDPDSLVLFDELVARHPELYSSISLAAAAPDMSFEFDMKSVWGMDILDLRRIGMLLYWKGQVLVARGDGDGAARIAIELLRLADKVDNSNLLNSMLGSAHRTIAYMTLYEAVSQTEVDAELVGQARELIDEIDCFESYRAVLKTELSFGLYHLIQSDPNDPWVPPGGVAGLALRLPNGPVIVAGNQYLDQMETAIARSAMPLTVQFPENEEQKWNILDAFGNSSGRFYDNIRNNIGREMTLGRAIRIVLALNDAKNSTNRSDWPSEYLVEIEVRRAETIDPFTGESMIVRREANRWIVYSAGLNKTDDHAAHGTDDCGMIPRPTGRD